MFNLTRIINGRENVPFVVKLPTTASESYKIGEALKLSSGALTKASGASKPEYICAENYDAPATGNKAINVYVVEPNQVWEVPVTFSSTAVAIVLGTKVTLHTNGEGVTDVTTNGVATVLDTLDANTNKANGDKILVRII